MKNILKNLKRRAYSVLKKLSVELKNIKVPELKTLFSDTIKIMIISAVSAVLITGLDTALTELFHILVA
jgi:preprotein translocase subunit SecE